MKSILRKMLCVMMVCLICMSGYVATATDLTDDDSISQVTPRYAGISTIVGNLDITSAGKAECYAEVYLYSGYTATMTATLLFKQKNATTWTDLTSWTKSGSGNFYIDKEHYIISGFDYCLEINIKVKDSKGNTVDDVTKYTSTRSF